MTTAHRRLGNFFRQEITAGWSGRSYYGGSMANGERGETPVRNLQGRLWSPWAILKQRLIHPFSAYIPEKLSIASKLALAFTILISSGMIALGTMVGMNQTRLLQQQMEKLGLTLVQQMSESSREPLLAGDQLGMEFIVQNLTSDANILGAAIYSDEGVLVQSAGKGPSRPIPSADKAGVIDPSQKIITWKDAGFSGDPRQYIAFLSPILFHEITIGYALLTFDYSVMSRARYDMVTMVVTTICGMLIIGVILSFYLGNRLTRPIYRLVEAGCAYTNGNFNYRIRDQRNDELGILMESLNHVGEGLLRKEQVEEVFSRYVSPEVAKKAISDLHRVDRVPLGGRHVEASVFFADIVGFTALSENMEPQEVSELLNHYFSQIARAVRFCHGHIDKFIGDCAMIVFGVPDKHEDHAFKALACAEMIHMLVEELNKRRSARELQTVEFRIGVNTGTMLAGNMGSLERMEYTVVGNAVNIASRLSHTGKPGEVIMTEEMYTLGSLRDRILARQYGAMKLRGKRDPVTTYKILDILDPFKSRMVAEVGRIIEKLEIDEA